MKTEANQNLEKELRLIGEKLDRLWVEARHATGQARTDIHNQIAPLREKQRLDREEQEALKNRTIALLNSGA
jgi:hypothetical protein